MATVTTGGSGAWSSVVVNAPWPGGTPPGAADDVVVALGHTLTVDGTYSIGSDTGSNTAMLVNGTLTFDATKNTSLTLKGNASTAAATTATINIGTSGTPINAGKTAALVFASAAPANYRYGLTINDTSNFTVYDGTTRTVNTTTTASMAVGATTCTVADSTGWAVGDVIVFAPTDGTYNHFDKRTITALAPITFSATTYAHASGCPVGNLTRQVTISSSMGSGANSAYIHIRHSSTASNGRRGINGLALTSISTNNGATSTTAFVFGINGAGYYDPFVEFQNVTAYNCSQGNGLCIYQALASTAFVAQHIAAFSDTATFTGNNLSPTLSTNWTFDDFVVYGSDAVGAASLAFGIGAQGITISNSKIWASNTGFAGDAGNGTISSSYVHTQKTSTAALRLSAGTWNINGSHIGDASLPGSPSLPYIFHMGFNYGAVVTVTATNCYFGTPSTSFVGNQAISNPNSSITIVNKNQDVTAQELYLPSGNFFRDNSPAAPMTGINRSKSAIRADCSVSTKAFSKTTTFNATSGTVYTIVGYLGKDASVSVQPSFTASGTGLVAEGGSALSYTMTGTYGQWEKFTLKFHQSTGSTQTVTLTFTAQSAAGGKAWLDGVPQPPFIEWCQHYGYTYDPANPWRTVDPYVVLSEAAAGALDGAGFTYGGGTLTMTGTHSIRDMYDYMKWIDAVDQTGLPPIMTTSDGVSFTLGANLVMAAGASLTGTGSLSLGANTLTIGSGASTTVTVTYNSGAAAWVVVAVSGIVNGSRLQVYDTTGASELYNGVPGTSKSLNAVWTANHSLRIRAAYQSGTTAYLPYSTTATLTSTGATVTLAQVVDTVYAGIGLDGSTLTEFSADIPHLYIDLSGGGTTSAQRLYAWTCYEQTTSGGIQSLFGVVVAEDTLNFKIDTTVANVLLFNLSASPVIVAGGYLHRSDGATVIAATSGSIQMDPSRAYSAIDTQANMSSLALVHGLVTGSPLVVTPSTRTAGTLTQTISDNSGTITVTRTA